MNMAELNKLVIRSIMEIPELRARQKKRDFSSAKEVFSEVQSALKTLLPVLRNYYRSEESQLDAIFAIEECAVNYVDLPRHQPYGTFLNDSVMKILNFLYDEDILPEDLILKWHNLPAKAHVKQFLPFFLHEPLLSPRRRQPSGGDLNEEDIGSLIRKIEALKKKLEPFIKWLQEAEEESE
jgi:eIF4-gamma/eIF5/eIF2-epsilon